LDGHQCRSGCRGKEKNTLYLPDIDSGFVQSVANYSTDRVIATLAAVSSKLILQLSQLHADLHATWPTHVATHNRRHKHPLHPLRAVGIHYKFLSELSCRPTEFHYPSQQRHTRNHWSRAAVRRSSQIIYHSSQTAQNSASPITTFSALYSLYF
jgi:hypothetical protein